MADYGNCRSHGNGGLNNIVLRPADQEPTDWELGEAMETIIDRGEEKVAALVGIGRLYRHSMNTVQCRLHHTKCSSITGMWGINTVRPR